MIKFNTIKTRIFNKKKIIVTGHTGFKGTWLTLWLKLCGANVLGISKGVPTNPSHYKKININKKIEEIFFDLKNRFGGLNFFSLLRQNEMVSDFLDPKKITPPTSTRHNFASFQYFFKNPEDSRRYEQRGDKTFTV